MAKSEKYLSRIRKSSNPFEAVAEIFAEFEKPKAKSKKKSESTQKNSEKSQ